MPMLSAVRRRVAAFGAPQLRRGLLLGALLVASFGLAPSPVRAQAPDTINVAVLGVQEIMRESSAAKGVLAELQKREQALKAEVEQKENALLAADQQLAQQRGTLSAEEFAQKRADIAKQAAEVRKYAQGQQAAIAQLSRTGESKIRTALQKVVTEVAQERKILMVLNKASVVMFPTDLDITDEVMQQLNAQLPSVSLTN